MKVDVDKAAKILYENPNLTVVQRRYFSATRQDVPPRKFDDLEPVAKEHVKTVVEYVIYAIEEEQL